jgi:hypothetical protein
MVITGSADRLPGSITPGQPIDFFLPGGKDLLAQEAHKSGPAYPADPPYAP